MVTDARQGRSPVRFLLAITFCLVLAQCAGDEDARVQTGQSRSAVAIIGVAESSDERDPSFSLLWRKLDEQGRFTEYDDGRVVDARTNSGNSIRIDGIPGEFVVVEIEPGVYALDSTFAILREDRINYFAQGVVTGPERPAFEVGPGEAVYLGIWELNLDALQRAQARLWRLDQADMRAVEAAAARSQLRLRETHARAVACTPHRLGNNSQRQVC